VVWIDLEGTPDLTIDFEANWTGILRARLVAAGCSVKANEDAQEISPKYFNVEKRRIEAKPRVVRLSRELCCPAAHQAGFDLVRVKAEPGRIYGRTRPRI